MNINAEIAPKIKGIPLLNQAEIDKALRYGWLEVLLIIVSKFISTSNIKIPLKFSSDWMNEMENAVSSSTDVSENNNPRTPTPSSGKKKKVPSGKVKGGKAPEKPIPPKEPAQPRLKVLCLCSTYQDVFNGKKADISAVGSNVLLLIKFALFKLKSQFNQISLRFVHIIFVYG